VININYCANCDKQTKSTYFARQLGFLCGNCAKIHGDKEIKQLTKEQEKIHIQICKINKDINKAIEVDCDHENLINTMYGIREDGVFKEIWRCPDCKIVIKKAME